MAGVRYLFLWRAILKVLRNRMPATGFALYVDDINYFTQERKSTPVKYLIHTEDGCLRAGLDCLGKLAPGEGELSPFGEIAETMELACHKGVTGVMRISKEKNEMIEL